MKPGACRRTPLLRDMLVLAATALTLLVSLPTPPADATAQPPMATTSGQAAGTATLTIFTSLTSPSGQPVAGPLAGYSYTLAGQNGLTTQTTVTNQVGQATFTGLAAGVYSISETPLAGSAFSSMSINGVSALQQQPFQVQAGGNYNVNVTNIVSGPTNVTIQVQLVDQFGQPVSSTNLSGFSFTIAGQSGGPTTISSTSSGQASTNLPAGAYSITESAAPGATLLNYAINGVPTQTGQFTVGLAPTTIIATNRTVSQNPGAGLRVVTLTQGCNNVVDTYPDGTTGAVFASAMAPAASVVSIWRFDNAAQAFRAVYFAPVPSGVPPPVDVSALSRLDPLFICNNAPGMLSEPSA